MLLDDADRSDVDGDGDGVCGGLAGTTTTEKRGWRFSSCKGTLEEASSQYIFNPNDQ